MCRLINRWMWRATVTLSLAAAATIAMTQAGIAARSASAKSAPAKSAPATAPAAGDAAARYRACLARVAEDPFAAVKEARAWQDEGGGDPARHCGAAGKLALGQAADAAEELESLAAAPGIPAARQTALLAQAGEAWLQAGQGDRAIGVLDRALAARPGDAALLMERARAQVESGRPHDAIADLGLAIDADPLRPEPYVLRASALRRTGAYDRAAADLATALSLDPRQPDALLERGLLRQARRRRRRCRRRLDGRRRRRPRLGGRGDGPRPPRRSIRRRPRRLTSRKRAPSSATVFRHDETWRVAESDA